MVFVFESEDVVGCFDGFQLNIPGSFWNDQLRLYVSFSGFEALIRRPNL